MGCVYSQNIVSGPLFPSKPWKMDFTKYEKQLNENDLDDLRYQFWMDRIDNNLEIWAVLKSCCEACLNNDYEKANLMFVEAELQATNHDLSECTDKEGFVYSIEKYCYSNPSNLVIGVVDDDTSIPIDSDADYQIRIQTTLTEKQIQLTHTYNPHTLLSSVIISIKEDLKEHYALQSTKVKLIYRGFVLEPNKTLNDYSIHPEYPILAIVQSYLCYNKQISI